MKTRTMALTLLGLLVLAGSAMAKEKEYLDGTLIDAQDDVKFRGMKKTIKLQVKVGDTVYVSYYKKEGAFNKSLHIEDFPVNSTVKVRLEKSNVARLNHFKGYLYIVRADGKEVQTWWETEYEGNK